MYCASALPAPASFCSAVAASANFLRRMAVFTPSSGSAGRENCRGAASAVPTASVPSTASSAGLRSATLRFDRDAHTLEEIRRQYPSRAHDDRVVSDLGDPAVGLDRHRLRLDLLYAGFHHDLKNTALRGRIDALAIACLGAVELRPAIGQHHPAAAGFGNACGGLERAVAPADHQHVLTLVLFRVYQPVDHLGHLLAGHAELARRAAAPDRQQDAARGVGAAVGLDDETLARAGDLLDPLLVVDLDAGPALGIRLDRLPSLLESGADEPHAAQFTRDENAGYRGLEFRRQDGNVDATPLAAEHQRDGIDRTGGLACAVADAIPGTYQDGPPVDDAKDRVVRLFRAGLDARAAADTSRGINNGVKRRRFRRTGTLQRLETLPLEPPPPPNVQHEQHQAGQPVDEVTRQRIH